MTDQDVNQGGGRGRKKRSRGSRRPDYLFVVTYGRSGSTLVQGLVNSLPGALVRGENNFYVLPLFRSWQVFSGCYRKHSHDKKPQGPRWAFYGINEAQPKAFLKRTRGLLSQQLYGQKKKKDVRILGFKEIRWYQIESGETEPFFDFFDQVFPGARYVLNRRDHDQVAGSGFWQKHELEEVRESLRRVEEIQDFLHETRPDRTHFTRYEQLTNGDQTVVDKELRSLASFVLGEEDDGIIAGMRSVLSVGHGPRPFGRSRTDEAAPSE